MVQTNEQEEEEAKLVAQVNIWKYVFGFVDMAGVRCAIELGIPEILENEGGRPITLSNLASAVGCPPTILHRVMRFLVHRGIFDERPMPINLLTLSNSMKGYVKTPLSSLLIKNGDRSLAPLIMIESSPVMLPPWLGLSKRVLIGGKSHAFEDANGKGIWNYMEENADYSKLFNDAMACDARLVVPAVIQGCPELFHGLEEPVVVVDVGGGDGTSLRLLVEAFPTIRGINFDLPHVVSVAEECIGVEHVGGDMFQAIPKADAVFIKWVLHDWGDEECIKILKNCRQAVLEDKGKVIIVEAVVGSGEEYEELERKEKESDGLEYVRLMLDMVMIAHTETGKERTLNEWGDVLNRAGFSKHIVHRIQAVQSVIVAYP